MVDLMGGCTLPSSRCGRILGCCTRADPAYHPGSENSLESVISLDRIAIAGINGYALPAETAAGRSLGKDLLLQQEEPCCLTSKLGWRQLLGLERNHD